MAREITVDYFTPIISGCIWFAEFEKRTEGWNHNTAFYYYRYVRHLSKKMDTISGNRTFKLVWYTWRVSNNFNCKFIEMSLLNLDLLQLDYSPRLCSYQNFDRCTLRPTSDVFFFHLDRLFFLLLYVFMAVHLLSFWFQLNPTVNNVNWLRSYLIVIGYC